MTVAAPYLARKVLLIDDEPFVLDVLARQLASLGLSDICKRTDGRQAWAEIENDPAPFGLVFCDLQMPDMDGIEFIRNLARIEFAGELILMSGTDERILETAERLALARSLNVLGAISKPIRLQQLQRVLGPASPEPSRVSPAAEPFPAQEVERALKNAEFINYYQPKVSFANGDLVGVETLVRWNHPSAGLVFPDRFIATAEQHGLIDELTSIVLADALQLARAWQEAGRNLHVAVNVSAASLFNLAFVDQVAEAAARAGARLGWLVLEVTESTLMLDPIATVDVLTRLRLREVGVSIDDFGTGHSSLANLRDLPFSELKIDRGFVHDADKDTTRGGIVLGCLDMAEQLGIHSVAEGIENRDDWDFLNAAGCEIAQGYYIGRPMAANLLDAWQQEWRIQWQSSN